MVSAVLFVVCAERRMHGQGATTPFQKRDGQRYYYVQLTSIVYTIIGSGAHVGSPPKSYLVHHETTAVKRCVTFLPNLSEFSTADVRQACGVRKAAILRMFLNFTGHMARRTRWLTAVLGFYEPFSRCLQRRDKYPYPVSVVSKTKA